MIFALSAPVLMLAAAIAIDVSNATIVRSKLNSAADAAALAALTPAMLGQSDATASAAAKAMFMARADAIGALVPADTIVTVSITHPASNSAIRQVTVDYTAQSNTIFSGVLNTATMTLGGESKAQASVPPNIDFYLLLDNSPSMALPATPTDLANMQKLTPTQDGGNSCAFACHQASTNNGDTQGNLCIGGSIYSIPTLPDGAGNQNQYCDSSKGLTQLDNFAMAKHNHITLRLDELSSGVSTLLNTANTYQNSGIWAAPPTYRFAAYSMDSLWQIGTSNTVVMPLTTDYVNAWGGASQNFGVMEMFANNATCGDAACDTAGNQGDVATNYDNAMSSIYGTMPTPGNGTNVPGDKPQEILFFVTDGVEDESNGARLIQPINGGATTNYCDLIKANNIKIAVLYTEYLAVPKNAFYEGNVAPFQANIGPQLQACASPGLFYDAAIGADLGQALSTLFQKAVQSPALSN
jgi:Flp pilus assembly protein TadG